MPTKCSSMRARHGLSGMRALATRLYWWISGEGRATGVPLGCATGPSLPATPDPASASYAAASRMRASMRPCERQGRSNMPPLSGLT